MRQTYEPQPATTASTAIMPGTLRTVENQNPMTNATNVSCPNCNYNAPESDFDSSTADIFYDAQGNIFAGMICPDCGVQFHGKTVAPKNIDCQEALFRPAGTV